MTKRRSGVMRTLADQRGIAMVTVLFIGMVMTVVVSSAAFITVREVRSGTDDRRAGKAHAYAEAGIDRMYQWLRSSSTGWRQITLSGCPYTGTTPTTANQITFTATLGPTGSTAAAVQEQGTYSVTLAPETPSNSYCSAVTGAVDTDTPPPIDTPYRMSLTSTGTHLSSTKVVKQIVELSAEDFPLGMSAQTLDANGNATVQNMSIVTTSTVTGRNQINMTGTDFFYTKSDFYPSLTGATGAQAMPASVHSVDRILLQGGRVEHTTTTRCNTTADKSGTESTWDGSATGDTISTCAVSPFPPTSKFTSADFQRIAGSGAPPRMTADDHLFFKTVAQAGGIYCSVVVGTSASQTCTRAGGSATGITATSNATTGSVTVPTAGITNATNICSANPCYVTAYIEFTGGNPLTNTVNWNANIPNTCTRGMTVLIIKNGSIRFGGTAQYSGALFAEDGTVQGQGSPYVEGVVAAKSIRMGGSPTFAMNACWLQNLPGPFIKVTALRWSESDR